MRKILIFGNSGSGKSTLAQQLCDAEGLGHLDLDSLAWLAGEPPQRRELEASRQTMMAFAQANPGWVIEGCYADLLELVREQATDAIFLDLPVEDCIANARRRPWEQHKYPSKHDQDENLDMLIEWISSYPWRDDVCSRDAHQALFDRFVGAKTVCRGNASINPA